MAVPGVLLARSTIPPNYRILLHIECPSQVLPRIRTAGDCLAYQLACLPHRPCHVSCLPPFIKPSRAFSLQSPSRHHRPGLLAHYPLFFASSVYHTLLWKPSVSQFCIGRDLHHHLFSNGLAPSCRQSITSCPGIHQRSKRPIADKQILLAQTHCATAHKYRSSLARPPLRHSLHNFLAVRGDRGASTTSRSQ